MAAIDLTGLPYRSATPRYLDFGGEQTGFLGDTQRINRLGNKMGLAIACAPVKEEPDGRIWTSKLRLARQQGALFPWPQPGLKIGAPGTPLVDGAVAGGTSLPIKGLTAYYAIRFGQAFSIIHGGRRYLHFAAAQAIADASGDATVTIDPMLRMSLSDGDTIELGVPMIEGLLGSGDMEWDIMAEPYTGIGTITITEQR